MIQQKALPCGRAFSNLLQAFCRKHPVFFQPRFRLAAAVQNHRPKGKPQNHGGQQGKEHDRPIQKKEPLQPLERRFQLLPQIMQLLQVMPSRGR